MRITSESGTGPQGGLTNLASAVSAQPVSPAHPKVVAQPAITRALEEILAGRLGFCFHYQPIVDLKRGLTVGYEALVRFPSEFHLTPDRWFAEAEKLGCRIGLEAFVTRQALQARKHLPRNCFLSLNVSPTFLLSREWEALLSGHASLAGVVIEITENELIEDYGEALRRIAAIRSLGGSVAVDDAGSGYASLTHVMQLKPDFVKLDRVFVCGCDAERAKAALIEMVGKAAGRLDAWVIAEGVETPAELDELIRLNVPLAQGYYLSRPCAEMVEVAAETSHAITLRANASDRADTIGSSTEFCTVCIGLEQAKQLLADQPQVDLAVLTDVWGRPERLVERHPIAGVRILSEFMKAQSASYAADVLERALTRPPRLRFDPLLVINEQGEFEGVVRLDRLVRQVLART